MELGVRGKERLHHSLILFLQHGARRVNETAAGLHKAGCGFKHRLLNLVDPVQLILGKTPAKIRIPAKRPRAGAGSVNQHAVKLPEKTAETLIVLIADRDRMHIREPRAAETGHHALEPLFIHVKSVEAAAGTHESADRKRLAAGTGAEIAHHLTALRRDEPRDQLAAFVLNINHAVLIERPVRDAGFIKEADAIRRNRCRHDFLPFILQLLKYLITLPLQEVHADIKRSAGRDFLEKEVVIRILTADAFIKPPGEFGAGRGIRVRVLLIENRFKRLAVVSDIAAVKSFHPVERRERHKSREPRRPLRHRRRHSPADASEMTERGVHRFGDKAAVPGTELVVTLEVDREQDIRRTVQLQHHAQRLREVIHEIGRDRVRILFADPSFRLPLRAAGRGGSGTAEALPLFFFRHSK